MKDKFVSAANIASSFYIDDNDWLIIGYMKQQPTDTI